MTSAPAPTILIADDSSTTRAFMRRTMVLCGIPAASIYEAENGKQAVALLQQQPVDVVLVDLQMPEMDGEELAHWIFNQPGKQKMTVLVVSADPNEGRIQALLKAGAKGYLGKPFTPEALRQALSMVIGAVPLD